MLSLLALHFRFALAPNNNGPMVMDLLIFDIKYLIVPFAIDKIEKNYTSGKKRSALIPYL